jgi:acyl-CoA synthetase (AMP-forming)/AMP-acid ligase II
VTAELLIGGAALARGYLGQPARTAERFVPDPYGPVPGARLYRTGDLCHRDADGQLTFAGRADRQVKVRGYRVEPGEIEVELASRPDIRAAAVAARPGPRGHLRLVAYCVPAPGNAPGPADLSAWLSQRLPPYLVPAEFISLAALPLTGTGKVDYAALPDPAAARQEAILDAIEQLSDAEVMQLLSAERDRRAAAARPGREEDA